MNGQCLNVATAWCSRRDPLMKQRSPRRDWKAADTGVFQSSLRAVNVRATGWGGSDDGGVFGVVFFDKDTVEVVDVVEVIE